MVVSVLKRMIYFGFDALETMESVLFWFPVAVIPTEEPSELTNRSGKSPLLARKKAASAHTSRKFLMPARACLGGAVHDQNKPMQNRLPALICIEQELPSSGEETPNTLFTWTVSVIGYEEDSQQENSYHHHRDSVPNCTTFSVMFSCFHKLNLFCVKSSNTNSFLIQKAWEIGLKLRKTWSW